MTRFPSYQARSDGNTDVVSTVVNGIDLNTLAYNIQTRTGQHTSAGLRGANAVTPGRDGAHFRAGKRREETILHWSMWASPYTPAGVKPTSAAQAYTNWRANMDSLLVLFDSSTAPLRVVQNGRECFVDVLAAIDPQMTTGNVGAFDVELRMVEAYWRDQTDTTFTSVSGTGAVALLSMTGFAGGTAPMSDLSFAVHGPITNPKITDEATGHYCQYTGTVGGSATWTLNCTTWASSVGATNVVADTIAFGVWSPGLMVISPVFDPTIAPQVRLDGTGAGSGTQLQVVGKRKYR